MRQGNFSEISTAIRNPLTRPAVPRQHHPVVAAVAGRAASCCTTIRRRTGRALSEQPPGPGATRTTIDQVLARVDQNIGNKVRLSVRYNWHDSYNSNIGAIPVQGITQPRVNKNTLVSYTHTLKPNLLQRFPHRLSPHRLRHVESLRGERHADAGSDLGIPGFDGDVKYNNPGLPSINISNFSGLGAGGTNWYQFDTTFQMSNVLAYNRGAHNVRVRVRPAAAGDRAPRGQRPARPSSTSPATSRGYSVADFMLGLPRTVITPADQIQGHVGGWRNGFFINDVWQASRNLTLSLGLRYELNTPVQTYAGLRLDARRGLRDDHPDHASRRRASSSTSRTTRTSRRGSAPPIASSEKTVLRAGYGIYYNPNQMNSFTFLTNNPPLAAVSTFTSDPANPTLSFSEPDRRAGAGGVARHHFADARSAERPQGPVELRHPARASGRHRARPAVRRLAHQHLDRSFFNNTPQPGAGAVDPRRPSQKFRQPPHHPERSDRRLRRGQHHPAQAHEPRAAGRRALHLVEDARHVHALERRRPDDGQLRHLGGLRPGQLGRPAPLRGQLHLRRAVPEELVHCVLKYVVAGWQVAGDHDDSERHAGQRHAQQRPGEHRHHGTAAPQPGRRRPALNCQPIAGTRAGAWADQLLRRRGVRAAGAFTFGNAPRNVLRGPKSSAPTCRS